MISGGGPHCLVSALPRTSRSRPKTHKPRQGRISTMRGSKLFLFFPLETVKTKRKGLGVRDEAPHFLRDPRFYCLRFSSRHFHFLQDIFSEALHRLQPAYPITYTNPVLSRSQTKDMYVEAKANDNSWDEVIQL